MVELSFDTFASISGASVVPRAAAPAPAMAPTAAPGKPGKAGEPAAVTSSDEVDGEAGGVGVVDFEVLGEEVEVLERGSGVVD